MIAVLRPQQHGPAHERTMNLEWAVAGLVIWPISLDTCLVCEAAPARLLSAREREGHHGETTVMIAALDARTSTDQIGRT